MDFFAELYSDQHIIGEGSDNITSSWVANALQEELLVAGLSDLNGRINLNILLFKVFILVLEDQDVECNVDIFRKEPKTLLIVQSGGYIRLPRSRYSGAAQEGKRKGFWLTL